MLNKTHFSLIAETISSHEGLRFASHEFLASAGQKTDDKKCSTMLIFIQVDQFQGISGDTTAIPTPSTKAALQRPVVNQILIVRGKLDLTVEL